MKHLTGTLALSQPRKYPVQERSRFTVEAILDAAIQVFERYGYAAGTTARIAERAGVSIGSLYQYFAHKDAILAALMERHLRDIYQIWTQTTGDTVGLDPILVHRMIVGIFGLHQQSIAVHQLMHELRPSTGWLAEQIVDMQASITRDLAYRLTTRSTSVLPDPLLAAQFIVQLVDNLLHTYIFYPPNNTPQDVAIAQIVIIVQRYIAPSDTSLHIDY